MGERSVRGLWEADRCTGQCGAGHYGLMASLRGRLFRDADFAGSTAWTTLGTGCRPAWATALLLQSHDGQDAEAPERTSTSLEVALGTVEDRPFAKSTLQVFRAQLILHARCGRY